MSKRLTPLMSAVNLGSHLLTAYCSTAIIKNNLCSKLNIQSYKYILKILHIGKLPAVPRCFRYGRLLVREVKLLTAKIC